MNRRFPVLSAMSVALRVLGWLVLFGGVISGLGQAIALAKCRPDCLLNVPWLLANVALLVSGVFAIVLGEFIGVAFAIEENTRRLCKQPVGTGEEG